MSSDFIEAIGNKTFHIMLFGYLSAQFLETFIDAANLWIQETDFHDFSPF